MKAVIKAQEMVRFKVYAEMLGAETQMSGSEGAMPNSSGPSK
jgi:hypothetical protein